jgi:ABC-type phosphate transport system substrate-binding protein
MKRLFVSTVVFMFFLNAAFAEILIIANKDVSETSLSPQEIREIFLGKRVLWSDNSRIRFAASGDPKIHELFLEQYIRLSQADWKTYWKRMVFTGRGLPPQMIPTEAEIIEFVSKTKGSVGYVSSEGIQEKEGVKVIGIR